jgi:tRNA/rRNA methyltransferase
MPLTPTFILVRPQLGENIGAVARVMANFGCRDLRIVAPRDGWPNPAADAMAAIGLPILQQARLHDTLEDALAGMRLVLACTARRRELNLPYYTPESAIAALRPLAKAPHPTALLFGPEASGLTNDDLALTDGIVTIPVDPAFPSLNLAQAAGILLYEWQKAAGAPLAAAPPLLAPREEMILLFEHLEAALDAAGFLRPPEKRPAMVRNLRVMLTRSQLSEQEVRSWRGIIKALVRGKRDNTPLTDAKKP